MRLVYLESTMWTSSLWPYGVGLLYMGWDWQLHMVGEDIFLVVQGSFA